MNPSSPLRAVSHDFSAGDWPATSREPGVPDAREATRSRRSGARGDDAMSTVAVVAHTRKSMGGGLPELREVLASEGFAEPIWHEVDKSKKAPGHARRAVADGAELVFVWGGDGMVQRCVDALAGSGAAIAILPAGT